jgi:hypothetical protein
MVNKAAVYYVSRSSAEQFLPPKTFASRRMVNAEALLAGLQA